MCGASVPIPPVDVTTKIWKCPGIIKQNRRTQETFTTRTTSGAIDNTERLIMEQLHAARQEREYMRSTWGIESSHYVQDDIIISKNNKLVNNSKNILEIIILLLDKLFFCCIITTEGV
jgi:hypothetical protein